MRTLTLLLCFVGVLWIAQAQQASPSPILFIYDASGSMWGAIDGKTKKEIAAEVLTNSVNALSGNQKVGLVAYGHRRKGDCQDVEFLVDLNNPSKEVVNQAVKGINPLGRTPLEYSAKLAIDAVRDAGLKATIILITDGIESCDGNICELVTRSKASGVDFKLHIVGFGLKEGETEQLECAATAGDGNYFDANNAQGLGEVLAAATSETVDDAPGNLSVFATKNGEAVDAWVKARKAGTKEDVDMSRSYRDSAWLYLPPGKYDLEIQPLEGTDIPATTIPVVMTEGEIQHRDISFDGGNLQVMATNNGLGWDALVGIIDPDTGKEVARTRTYGREQSVEVPPGTYTVTFSALKINGTTTHEAWDVAIQGGTTTSLSHNFDSGTAKVGVQTAGGELVDATVNIHDAASGKNVARGRTYTRATNNPKTFVLSPGSYDLRIKTLGVHKGVEKKVALEVKTGETTEKTITIKN